MMYIEYKVVSEARLSKDNELRRIKNGKITNSVTGFNDTWFVDAKHVEIKKASFEFSRIEPNQRTAMERAVGKGKIKNVGFFIFWERTPDKLYFFPFRMWKTLEDSGCKSVKMVDMICIQL